MASVDSLFSRVRMFAPGASDPLMQEQLELAAKEFAEDTWVCQEDITPVEDADGALELRSRNGYSGIGVIRLAANGQSLWSKWPDDLANASGWTDMNTLTASQPQLFTVGIEPLTIRMVPLATSAQAITATIAVAPVIGDNEVPDVLVGHWSEALICRALSQLLLMPNQVFTSPALAAVKERQYLYYRNAARIEANRQYARNGGRVYGVRFGGR